VVGGLDDGRGEVVARGREDLQCVLPRHGTCVKMDSAAFRTQGHALVDFIADYYERLARNEYPGTLLFCVGCVLGGDWGHK